MRAWALLPCFAMFIAGGVAAQPAGAAKPGWPSVGDRWIYDVRDADHPDRKYQIVVEVQEVASSTISDVVIPEDDTRVEQSSSVRQRHQAGPYLIGAGSGVIIFAPYLRAFQELQPGMRWSNIDFVQLGACSGLSSLTCTVNAHVVGREKVTVKAGTFDAWKIEVTISLRNTIGQGSQFGGVILLQYWYAEEVKRTVKSQSRTRGSWDQPDVDLELVSYQLKDSR